MEMIPAGAVEIREKPEPPLHGSAHVQSLPVASSIHNPVAPTATWLTVVANPAGKGMEDQPDAVFARGKELRAICVHGECVRVADFDLFDVAQSTTLPDRARTARIGTLVEGVDSVPQRKERPAVT
jgi:hypothetical protein